MVKSNTTFSCEVCGHEYATAEAATECEAQPDPLAWLKLQPGDFVGFGAHAWWWPDTSWALTAAARRGDHPSTHGVPPEEWQPYTGPVKTHNPQEAWFLPIWRVVGLGPIRSQRYALSSGGLYVPHERRVVVWSPRHANSRDGRRLQEDRPTKGWRKIPRAFHPVLTDEEAADFAQVQAALADGGSFHDGGGY